jgi:hypothetical protein
LISSFTHCRTKSAEVAFPLGAGDGDETACGQCERPLLELWKDGDVEAAFGALEHLFELVLAGLLCLPGLRRARRLRQGRSPCAVVTARADCGAIEQLAEGISETRDADIPGSDSRFGIASMANVSASESARSGDLPTRFLYCFLSSIRSSPSL